MSLTNWRDEMKVLAKVLYEKVLKWLHQNYADLIAKKQ
jgi:hypothetical protein